MEEAKKEITGRICAVMDERAKGYMWMLAQDGPRQEGGGQLHFLANGDLLTIYNKDKTEILKELVVDIDPAIRYVEGLSIHEFGPPTPQYVRAAKGFPRDIAPKEWADICLREFPVKLVHMPEQKTATPQPL